METRRPILILFAFWLLAGVSFSCGRTPANASENLPQESPSQQDPSTPKVRGEIRATGTIQAVRYQLVQVPRITGRSSQLTLVRIVPNGSVVREGEVLAEFDPTEQIDAARQAQAQYDDLGHQVEQKLAENQAEAAKRRLALREAETDLEQARIQLRKGPLLSEIERLKNERRAAAAEARVASLGISGGHRAEAEASALRILSLQRDRQQVALERAENNLSKLILRAPLAGMVALELIYRNGSFGHMQEGDQSYGSRPLLRIFDPSEMEVVARVEEPDGAALVSGKQVRVQLDAYRELEFSARLVAASPVAASALGSPIKTFLARFRLDQTDPHLLPDLSAVVIIPTDQ